MCVTHHPCPIAHAADMMGLKFKGVPSGGQQANVHGTVEALTSMMDLLS